MQAWRFRDPAANEPSDAAYRSTQVQGVVGLVVAAVVIVVIWFFLADRDVAADRAGAGERTTTSPSPPRAANPYLPPEPEVVTRDRRFAQWWPRIWRPGWNPCSIRAPTAIGRSGRRWMR